MATTPPLRLVPRQVLTWLRQVDESLAAGAARNAETGVVQRRERDREDRRVLRQLERIAAGSPRP